MTCDWGGGVEGGGERKGDIDNEERLRQIKLCIFV